MVKTVKDGYTYEIRSLYKLGGINHFNLKKEPRGFRIIFSKFIETVDDNGNVWTESTPMDPDNMVFFVKETKKFSQKQENRINDWIKENQEELFRLYFEDRANLSNVIFYYANKDFKINIK